ncbi:MAG: helix-turn-helix transcriptional regulator [Spirochaetia bacterium]|nr:helix-turn-helix transcriptional regulator [Spirochaetia bacterium]MBQ6673540.1 helix-turn-helix transcriptional regulator [Spirochaetia bacterium]MBQ6905224.1 helix-turn-helix transcriptional regulator [Spirochaetia bacterium]
MEINFRKNLRALLDYEYISVKELAEMTGIPKRSIENYLGSRASMPPADYAFKIAKALHVNVEYLISGSAETYKSPGFNALNRIIAENREYSHIFNDIENLSENDIRMILDILVAIIKNRINKKES